MKNGFTTVILFIIMLILIIGIIVLGGAIYIDLFDAKSNQIAYKVDSIITEEQEPSSVTEEVHANISDSILSSQVETDNYNQATVNKFFYNQLSDNQKIIYNGLYKNKNNLKQGNYVINFGNAFSTLLSKEGGSDQLSKDYQTAVEAFTHDNPELFYIDVNKMYINLQTTTKFLKTTYDVYISAAQDSTYLSDEFTNAEQIENGIQEIEKVKNYVINNLKGSDYDKILSIHNYLVNSIEYDSTYSGKGIYGIYGALVTKKCVCEGYAKSLKYLANAVGIDCEIMQGKATNSTGTTESHAWNCVKINNVWYEMDVTWDDPIVIGTGKITKETKFKYFLKGSNTFEKDHTISYQFSEGGKYFEYPTISQNDYK